MSESGLTFYRDFEDRFRGSRGLILSRLRQYAPFLQPLNQIGLIEKRALDLGCGRGEWLEVLAELGFAAHGVDLDDGMLQACRERGFAVERRDAIEALKEQPDASLCIVSAFHVVEHIAFDQLRELVAEALRVLVPGGLLILETPNPENLQVGCCNFYLDPTHQRPIPPQLLTFLPEHTGFIRSRVVRLQESAELRGTREIHLIEVLGGASPDYAVVAQKAAAPDIIGEFDAAFQQEFGITLHQLAQRYDTAAQQRVQVLREDLGQQNADFTARLSEFRQAFDHAQRQTEALREDARQAQAQLAAQLQTQHSQQRALQAELQTLHTTQASDAAERRAGLAQLREALQGVQAELLAREADARKDHATQIEALREDTRQVQAQLAAQLQTQHSQQRALQTELQALHNTQANDAAERRAEFVQLREAMQSVQAELLAREADARKDHATQIEALREDTREAQAQLAAQLQTQHLQQHALQTELQTLHTAQASDAAERRAELAQLREALQAAHAELLAHYADARTDHTKQIEALREDTRQAQAQLAAQLHTQTLHLQHLGIHLRELQRPWWQRLRAKWAKTSHRPALPQEEWLKASPTAFAQVGAPNSAPQTPPEIEPRTRNAIAASEQYHRTNRKEGDLPLNDAPALYALLRKSGDDFIHSAYIAILGRAPDSAGLRYYLNRLQAGYGKRSIVAQIARSPERTQRNLHILSIVDDAAFVTAAYHALLGRAPDPDGQQSALHFLQNGGERGKMLESMANSAEGQTRASKRADFEAELAALIEEERKARHWFWGWLTRHERAERQLNRLELTFERLASATEVLGADLQHDWVRPEPAFSQDAQNRLPDEPITGSSATPAAALQLSPHAKRIYTHLAHAVAHKGTK